ncbi:MAG: hypothetical protein C0501_09160 [Isosphaera sp.]|nr:hypothetical protein [Isosphaera sp.]
MSPAAVRLRVTVVTGLQDIGVAITRPAATRVADLIATLVAQFGLPGTPAGWELVFAGRPLVPLLTLGEVLPSAADEPIPVTLRPISHPADTLGTPAYPPPARPSAPPPPQVAAPSRRRESADEDSEDAGFGTAEQAPAGKAKRRARTTEARRATVRYYTRMNPARVFPLLVTLTRQEVEEVVKRHVGQKATGPLELDGDTPVEIEPVLPGCDVYPPAVVTRLGADDQVFTFHVVPHVLGEVTGARVLLRQDHAVLAEIGLDVRVRQRTAVVISGLSAVVLPAASAAMKHFGLDFTPKDESSPYLAALNLLFGAAPLALTAVLAAVTGVLWWFTRPKGKDVFWDVTTKPAGGK